METRKAHADDEKAIKELLSEANLPYNDIKTGKQDFILAYENDRIVGVAGIEIYNDVALLRSFAMRPGYRGKGLGSQLYRKINEYAISRNIKELYLLTTTAEKFFKKLGFVVISRDNIPGDIRNSEEFASICPTSALCMTKKI